jgi:hypothetical protein
MIRAVKRLAALVAFPIALVHELGHYLAALPWADDSIMLIDPAGGRATTFIEFSDEAPRWAVAIACVFPTVLGVVVATGALVWWGLAGLAFPVDLIGWMRLSIGALSWGVFTWPSPDDLDGARNGPPETDVEAATLEPEP